MRIMMSAALAAASFAWAGEAAAQCVCGCIDGQVGVICKGSMQAAPQTCAPCREGGRMAERARGTPLEP